MRRIIATLLVTSSLIAFTGSAFAQDAPAADAVEATDNNDEAIVVTAQRREERVTDVPISITVVDAAQLDRQQVNSVADLSRVSPSLEVTDGFSNSPGGGGVIRGVGTQTFNTGAAPAVGIVVDQVPLGNANFSDLFDLARVEVLKGPQGTLFGLTTSAGVINVTTQKPDPYEFTARIAGEVSANDFAGSEFGQQIIKGVVNIPISETGAVRISGIGNFRQGPQYNRFLDERNKNDRFAVRGRLFVEPTPEFTIDIIGDYSEGDQRGIDFFTPAAASQAFKDRVLADCGVAVEEGTPDYCSQTPQHRKEKNFGASANFSYDFGPAILTSISAYRRNEVAQNVQSIFRMDTEFFKLQNGPIDQADDLFSQEIRLSSPGGSRLDWTLGVFHSDADTRQDPRTFFRIRGTRAPEVLRSRGFINIEDRSYAAFGQATYHVTDSLHLTAGARYTDAKLSYTQQLVGGGNAVPQQLHSKKWSWRLATQYDLAPDTMVYASATRGFKGGQITLPDLANAVPEIIRPEIPLSFEAGLKTTLFDRLVMDLSIFHSKFDDFQSQLCTQDIVNGQVTGISCDQTNLEYVKSRGAEINFFGKVTDRLSVGTGFVYAKTTYPNGLLGTDGSDLTGRQLPNAPRYKFVFSGQYEAPLWGSNLGFVSLDTVWKSRVSYQQTSNRDESFRPHWVVGGRVGLKAEDEKWQLGLFVRNLFKVREPVNLLDNHYEPDALAAIYTTRAYRQVGLSFDLNF